MRVDAKRLPTAPKVSATSMGGRIISSFTLIPAWRRWRMLQFAWATREGQTDPGLIIACRCPANSTRQDLDLRRA